MWKYVMRVALRQRLRFALFFFIILLSFFLSTVTPYFNGVFIDMLSKPTSIKSVVEFSLLIAGLGIVGAVISYLANMVTSKFIIMANMDLIREEISKLQESQLIFVEKQNPAYLTQRLSQDVHSVGNFVLSNYFLSIINLLLIAIIIYFLIHTSLFLGLFAIGLCCIYVFLFLLLKKPIYSSQSQKKEAEAKMYGFMSSQVGNTFGIQLNSQYEEARTELSSVFKRTFPFVLRSYKYSYVFASADSIISAIFQAALFIFAGIQIVNEKMTIGTFVAANLYFNLFIKTMKYYVNFYKQYQDARASFQRLKEITAYPKIKSNGRKISDITSISLVGTNFCFPDTTVELFHALDYTFVRGNSYSIIGDNGAGKSTLMKIISDLYPAGDTVYFNSESISEINMRDVRKAQLTCVPQTLHMPEQSVESYICEMLSTDIGVIKTKLGESEYLKSYSQFVIENLDKPCHALSIGEFRKINIWIAINRVSCVLILDEPTTGLDSHSKSELIEYVKDNPQKLMLLIMSHDEEILSVTTKKIRIEKGMFVTDEN